MSAPDFRREYIMPLLKTKEEVREVETGIRNRVSIEVKSGLAEGDKVVVSAGGGNASGGDRNSRRGMRMPPMF